MTERSALYAGQVIHVRSRPKRHRLRYRVFSLLVDLDEMPRLDGSLRLFSHNRRGLFSVHDRDHGDGEIGGLKRWVGDLLREGGIAEDCPQILMLCYPRILGYVFNPLTVYFCKDAAGSLRAVLYEVCNTFGERHSYLIPVEAGTDEDTIAQQCEKRMYVSPFMPMDCHYRFRVVPPGDDISIAINEEDSDGPLLHASFSGKRRALTDRTLLGAFFTYPLMTLKVTAAIHWEALRLWAKGVPIHRHARAKSRIATTIVPATATGSRMP